LGRIEYIAARNGDGDTSSPADYRGMGEGHALPAGSGAFWSFLSMFGRILHILVSHGLDSAGFNVP